MRKGIRSCTQHPTSKFLRYSHFSKPVQVFVTHLSHTIPNTVEKALQNSEWKAAIFDEMNALENNETWEMVRPCLVGRKFSVFCIQTFRKQGKRV